jgi:hypothetical protein
MPDWESTHSAGWNLGYSLAAACLQGPLWKCGVQCAFALKLLDATRAYCTWHLQVETHLRLATLSVGRCAVTLTLPLRSSVKLFSRRRRFTGIASEERLVYLQAFEE